MERSRARAKFPAAAQSTASAAAMASRATMRRQRSMIAPHFDDRQRRLGGVVLDPLRDRHDVEHHRLGGMADAGHQRRGGLLQRARSPPMSRRGATGCAGRPLRPGPGELGEARRRRAAAAWPMARPSISKASASAGSVEIARRRHERRPRRRPRGLSAAEASSSSTRAAAAAMALVRAPWIGATQRRLKRVLQRHWRAS